MWKQKGFFVLQGVLTQHCEILDDIHFFPFKYNADLEVHNCPIDKENSILLWIVV